MDVRITDMKTDDIKDAIGKGDIDAGTWPTRRDGRFCKDGLWHYEELFVYVSPADPNHRYDKNQGPRFEIGEFPLALGPVIV